MQLQYIVRATMWSYTPHAITMHLTFGSMRAANACARYLTRTSHHAWSCYVYCSNHPPIPCPE